MVTKAADYLTPLNIKEGKQGDWTIVKKTAPPGSEFATANMRCAIFGGQRSRKVSWPHPTTWHYLKEGNSTWMTDLPCEQAQMQLAINRIKRGTVLVGGLGLGLFPTMLSRKKSVKRIVVIEKEQDVIDLVRPYVQRSKVEIVHADLFDELRNVPAGYFDYAFYDIWTGDGEATFFETVCPLIELSKGKIKNQPLNWQEDVMRGQLTLSLNQRVMLLDDERFRQAFGEYQWPVPPWEMDTKNDSIRHNWSVPFFLWKHETKPDTNAAASAAAVYAGIYGSWDWERLWADYIESL